MLAMLEKVKGDVYMKKEENSDKKVIIYGAAITIAGLILYPIYDLIWCKFITNSKFIYTMKDHVIQPITIGIIMTVILYAITYSTKKKK